MSLQGGISIIVTGYEVISDNPNELPNHNLNNFYQCLKSTMFVYCNSFCQYLSSGLIHDFCCNISTLQFPPLPSLAHSNDVSWCAWFEYEKLDLGETNATLLVIINNLNIHINKINSEIKLKNTIKTIYIYMILSKHPQIICRPRVGSCTITSRCNL